MILLEEFSNCYEKDSFPSTLLLGASPSERIV